MFTLSLCLIVLVVFLPIILVVNKQNERKEKAYRIYLQEKQELAIVAAQYNFLFAKPVWTAKAIEKEIEQHINTEIDVLVSKYTSLHVANDVNVNYPTWVHVTSAITSKEELEMYCSIQGELSFSTVEQGNLYPGGSNALVFEGTAREVYAFNCWSSIEADGTKIPGKNNTEGDYRTEAFMSPSKAKLVAILVMSEAHKEQLINLGVTTKIEVVQFSRDEFLWEHFNVKTEDRGLYPFK